jgi:hypothetical protein
VSNYVWKFQANQGAFKTAAQAYNECMKHHLSHLSRTASALLLLALGTVVNAQTPEATAATAATVIPQKATERIRTEDAGSRIDEIRVGGETQSITVQPKTGSNVPAYEVLPSSNTKGSAPGSSSGGTTGSRVWNVLKF